MKTFIIATVMVLFASTALASTVTVTIGSGEPITIDTGVLNDDLLAGSGSTSQQMDDLLDSLPDGVDHVAVGITIDDVVDGALDHTIGEDSAIDFVDDAARDAYEADIDAALNAECGCDHKEEAKKAGH